MKKVFIATVQIAMIQDTEDNLDDLLSEALNELRNNSDFQIIDWEYPQGEDSYPKLAGEITDRTTYELGQAFRMNPETQL